MSSTSNSSQTLDTVGLRKLASALRKDEFIAIPRGASTKQAQQDASEMLSWLLDVVHCELNGSSQKGNKYTNEFTHVSFDR